MKKGYSNQSSASVFRLNQQINLFLDPTNLNTLVATSYERVVQHVHCSRAVELRRGHLSVSY